MHIEETQLPGILVLTNKKYGDDRGWFSEVFRKNEFEEAVGHPVRGIHFQNPHPQGKLVRVVEGEVFDVAVDLRKSSPTCGQWFGISLSAENGKLLWIPEGFGHGFYVTGNCAHFVYECTDYYHPEAECSLKHDDGDIGIVWPIAEGTKPRTSSKDNNGVPFTQLKLFD